VLRPSRGVCTAKPMKALRVLIVEDDALIGLLLSELLAGMGHKVCAIAATEADAVSAAIRNRPDLMIVDAGLGRGSGISAVDEILRAGSLAHVFISGDADMVRAHRPEAVILRKPFCEAELVKTIEAALDAVAG
jgi:DNA-binding response OmpR family regulator